VQANCPKCAHKVVVDDAKAPDRAFTVKCPKCQTPVKFAGKAAADTIEADIPKTAPPEPPAAIEKPVPKPRKRAAASTA